MVEARAPGSASAFDSFVDRASNVARVAYRGDARPPQTVSLLDETATRDLEDALVLGVGMTENAGSDTVAHLARHKAVGLVVKSDRIGDAVLPSCAALGLSLFVLRPDITWDEGQHLLRAAVGEEDERLADLLSDGNGLLAICRRLATMIGHAVTIEDPHGQVLAYSAQGEHVDPARLTTILQGSTPVEVLTTMRRNGVFARLDRSPEPLFFADPSLGIDGRFGMRVVDGQRVIGYIWVVDTEHELAQDVLTSIVQAARLASFYLIRQRLEADLAQRARDDLIRDVISRDVTSPAIIAARGRSVGLQSTHGYQAVVTDVDQRGLPDADAPDRLESLKRIVRDRVTAVSRDLDQGVIITSVGDSLLVLVPARTPEQARLLGTRILTACSSGSPPVAVSVGIGGPLGTLADLASAYEQACVASTVAQTAFGGCSIAEYAQLGPYLLLLSHPDVISPVVTSLLAYDQEHGSDYASTLDVFLDSFGNRSLTARRLFIHLNTLVYRLRRIEELGPIDLSDADARLAAQLEYRSMRLRGWRRSAPTAPATEPAHDQPIA